MPSQHPICIAGNSIVLRAGWLRSTDEVVETEINVRQSTKQRGDTSDGGTSSHLDCAYTLTSRS
jgi:hypothetical protein